MRTDERTADRIRYDEKKGSIICLTIISIVLVGIIGGIGFSFLPAVLVGGNPWYTVGIPAMILGILGYKIDGCSSGCGWLIWGALGMAFFCWLLSAIPIIATISIGAVLGALIGGGAGWFISLKIYDIDAGKLNQPQPWPDDIY